MTPYNVRAYIKLFENSHTSIQFSFRADGKIKQALKEFSPDLSDESITAGVSGGIVASDLLLEQNDLCEDGQRARWDVERPGGVAGRVYAQLRQQTRLNRQKITSQSTLAPQSC